jgi:hypothetical protein
MARKPNYRFERSERERQKAAKIAARLEEKKQRSTARQAARDGTDTPDGSVEETNPRPDRET